MDRLFKRILFFLLMPIYAPMALLSHLTYEWWLALHKKNLADRILFYILAIFYGPMTFILHRTYDWWTELFTK
jgi:hypothetical protein